MPKVGDADGILDNDTSVASGRSIPEIAEGVGNKPKPFMLRKAVVQPDAVWDPNHGLAADERAKSAGTSKARFSKQEARESERRQRADAGLHRAAALPLGRERSLHWRTGCTRSSSTGIACSCGSRTVAPHCSLAKPSTGPTNSRPSPSALQKYPMPSSTERLCPRQEGLPNFSALQAALSEGRDNKLKFGLRRDVCRRRGLAQAARCWSRRKERLKQLLDAQSATVRQSISFVEHFEVGGESMMKSAREHKFEGVISKRADAPYRSGRTDNWTKAKIRIGHEVVIGGWKTTVGQIPAR